MGNPRNKNKKLRGEKRMQKWKVCKKLMAVILTLCMALPLISNQYLVVRAEETGTGTTTSYMDVDDLQIGTNKVRWEKETVSYPISNSETSTWTGKVLHIDKLDDESYTLKFKYDGDTSNLVYEVDMYSYENGCMNFAVDFLYRKHETKKYLRSNFSTAKLKLQGAKQIHL